jgi:hypothetical protein
MGVITPPQPLEVPAAAVVIIANPTAGANIEEAIIRAFPATGQPQSTGGGLAWMPRPDAETLSATVDASGVRFMADLTPGRYVVSAFLRVPQGDVSYGVILEVR